MSELHARCDTLGWRVSFLSRALGATIDGLDLTRPLSPEEEGTLVDLLTEHLVLVLPGQDLSAARHVEVGQIFGEPLVHPFLEPVPDHPAILKVAKEPTDDEVFGGEHWHADITFMNPPSSVSLLHAIDVPAEPCGDTLFANQFLAYEQLSTGMQTLLESLQAVHVYPEMAEGPDTVAHHPVVRTHPLSQRKGLFVNPAFVDRFVGMTAAESQPLLEQLYAHQIQPEFQARVAWDDQQLTIWDNRAVVHYAMNDYPGKRRVLRRVTSMERSTSNDE